MSVFFSAFFSGAETGMYRLSRIHLRLGAERRRPLYRLLASSVQDSYGIMISLLLGNNLANYFATTLATLLLLRWTNDEERTQFLATAVMTPLLFLFGETIPKNVFYYQANRYMPPLAPLVWFFHRTFTRLGAVAAMKRLSGLFERLLHIPMNTQRAVDMTRREKIKQFFRETHEEGLVSKLQKEMMDRLIRIHELPVTTVMIPLSRIEMADVNTSRRELIELLRRSRYSHLPVYEGSRSNIIGVFDPDVALASGEAFDNLRPFLQPLQTIPATATISEAVNSFRRRVQPFVLVSQAAGPRPRIIGMAARRDLVEELAGELS